MEGGWKTGDAPSPKRVRFFAGARGGSGRCSDCRSSKAFEGADCGRSECRRNQVGAPNPILTLLRFEKCRASSFRFRPTKLRRGSNRNGSEYER